MNNTLKQYTGFRAGRIVSFVSVGPMSGGKKQAGEVPSVVLKVEGETGFIDVIVPLAQYFGHNNVEPGGYYAERDDGTQTFIPAAAFGVLFGHG